MSNDTSITPLFICSGFVIFLLSQLVPSKLQNRMFDFMLSVSILVSKTVGCKHKVSTRSSGTDIYVTCLLSLTEPFFQVAVYRCSSSDLRLELFIVMISV